MNTCPQCGQNLAPGTTPCPYCDTPLVSATLPLGTPLLNGRYSIGRNLGQGGFGITYRGADRTLQRSVAIKELFPYGSSRHTTRLVTPNTVAFEAAKTQFLEEARTLAKFKHPAIVQVLDTFEENGTAYLVMEFLEGQTLQERIGMGMSAAEVSKLGSEIAKALGVLHGGGRLHRDIKPDNM